jgi:elongation factor G
VKLEVAPNEQGKGFAFDNKVPEAALPKAFAQAVKDGLSDGMTSGVIAGYPMVDVKVTLTEARFDVNKSVENAYRIAATTAFKAACNQAKPTLLEPVMKVEVVTPEEFMGDVIGDLNARRGRVTSMNPKDKFQIIDAEVPLAKMFGYSTDLRSKSQGRASYTMQFSHYAAIAGPEGEETLKRLRGY